VRPYHLIGSIMDLTGSLIAFAISLLAYKAFKVTGYRIFLYFFLGFGLLGVGSLGRSTIILSLTFLPLRGRPPIPLLMWVNSIVNLLKLTAYLSIAIGYTLQAKRAYLTAHELILSLFLLRFSNPFIEALNTFITLYLVFHSLVVFLENKLPSSFGIFTGFGLMWASHFLTLLCLMRALPLRYLSLAEVIYWASFVPFLSVLIAVVRAK